MEAAKHASAAWGNRLGAVLANGKSGMDEFQVWRQSLPEALHEAVTPRNLDKVSFVLFYWMAAFPAVHLKEDAKQASVAWVKPLGAVLVDGQCGMNSRHGDNRCLKHCMR
jgi:hypothetical protein